MYKMTTMYTYLAYPLDIFGSPNNYVKVKMVQTCSWGNENSVHETYITQFLSLPKNTTFIPTC